MRDQVAGFRLIVGIDQDVTQLEVAVNDTSRVNVLETAEGVINKRLEMIIREGLRDRSRQGALGDWWTLREVNQTHNGMQIGLHQLPLEGWRVISDGDPRWRWEEKTRV